MIQKPIYFLLTIDSEEDQWDGSTGKPPTVSNIYQLFKLQDLLRIYNVLPTYLVTYPVANNDKAVAILKKYMENGFCEIGAHLHPWNTPPFLEEKNNKNTMIGNLPYDVQAQKIRALTGQIEKRFGTKPKCFRAGRFGLGKETVGSLIDHGYLVDTSVTPFTSWECYEGPSFLKSPFRPFLLDKDGNMTTCADAQKIIEVPITIGYNRWPFEKYVKLDKFFDKTPKFLHARGMASRLNYFKKIWLSPEADSANNMLNLTKLLLDHRVRILNMTFHSNSLVPGLTPFVRNENDLNTFYGKIETYLKKLRELVDLKPIVLSEAGSLFLRGEFD